MFVHVVADHAARGVGAMVLTEEYMDASNFGVRASTVAGSLGSPLIEWSYRRDGDSPPNKNPEVSLLTIIWYKVKWSVSIIMYWWELINISCDYRSNIPTKTTP